MGPSGKLTKQLGAIAFVLVAWWFAFGKLGWQELTYQFDLVPFYCGGAMVAAHESPYTVEPLRTCEHGVGASFRKGTKLAVPAPQPAYELAAFAVLSHIPFSLLSKLWTLLQIATFIATVFVLVRLTRLPVLVVFASLGVSDFYSSLILGQTASICIFGISLLALGLERKRYVPIALGLMLSAAEPHIALPAFVAVTLFSKQRLAAIGAGVILVVVSVVTMPFAELVQYVTAVLPAHALSEVNNQDQFSLAYYLHELGLSASASIAIAKAQYALMVVVSIVLARLAAPKFGDAVYGTITPALVLIGGPFLHVHEAAAAIPALLLIASRAPSRYVYICLAALAVPWVNFSSIITVLPAATIALIVLLHRGNIPRPAIFATAIVATFGEGFAAVWVALTTHRFGHPNYGPILPGELAEHPWQILIDLQDHDHVLLANLTKFPTELALLGLLTILVVVAKSSLERPSRVTEVASAAQLHLAR